MSSAPMLNYFRMFTKCAEEPTNWVHFSWSDRPNPLGGPFEPGVLPGTCSGATGLLIRQGVGSCSVPRGCRQKSLLQIITARSWQMAKYDAVLLA